MFNDRSFNQFQLEGLNRAKASLGVKTLALQSPYDPDARFHFVRPFSTTPDRKMFGTAFDTPEAEVRRTVTQSAAEKLIVDRGLDKDPRLALMARLGHVWEITPWAYTTDSAVKDLSLRMFAAKGTCSDLSEVPSCAERVFSTLDTWYEAAGR